MRHALLALLSLGFLLSCSPDHSFQPLTIPMSQESIEQGRLLFHGLAACGFCHGEKVDPNSLPVGGRAFYDVYGEVRASNLTPARSGLGNWEAKDFVKALRQNKGKGDRYLSPYAHRGSEWMSDQDMLSILAYLRTIPATENRVEKRKVDFFARNSTGFFEGEREVQGFVPSIDPKHELQYGKYLVDNVARCNSCHASPASLLSSEGYLAGGSSIKFDSDEKIAPGITNSVSSGIGSWSENDIVHYLKSGETPDHKHSDPNFCPVTFFKNTPESNLRAMAKYLKSDATK